MERACSTDKMVAKDTQKDKLIKQNPASVSRSFVSTLIKHCYKSKKWE